MSWSFVFSSDNCCWSFSTTLTSCYCLQRQRRSESFSGGSNWLCQQERYQCRERMHILPERRLLRWRGRRIGWPGSRRTKTNQPVAMRPCSCSLLPPLMRAEGESLLFPRDVLEILKSTERPGSEKSIEDKVLFFSGPWSMAAAAYSLPVLSTDC